MESFIKWIKLFTNPRMLSTLLLGFSSGLPLALCSGTLQAWFTVAGINIVAIGALTLVQYPYTFKWLWAPLLDRYVPPFLGRRRGWIMVMQIMLAIVMAIMAFLKPQTHAWWLGILAVVLAFFSSTQDIGIDAYRTDLLKPEERGLGSAMVTSGYRIAMVISGGLALVIAANVGWRVTYLLMAGLMIFGVLITCWSPELDKPVAPPKKLSSAVFEPFKEFLSRDAAIAILLFIILYKISDAMVLALGSTFLIRDVGFSLADVGAIYKMVGIGASVIGAFMGGILMVRLGLFRSLMIFGITQGISNLLYMSLAMTGKNYTLLVAAITCENFFSGMGTVAFVAFLMSLCDYRYTATQFALLSAFSAVGRIFVGPIAGVMVEHIGWVQFYFWSVMSAIPGLLLLWWMRIRLDKSKSNVFAMRQTSEA